MKPARIFIVEDKTIIAETLVSALEKTGYTVCGLAASGEDALPRIVNEVPDVVLMDIRLAGTLDGIQVVEMLNKIISVPVIYLTDFHDQETIERAKHTHPAAYLLKPFKSFDLFIAIDIAICNASQGKEAVPGNNQKTEEDAIAFNDRFFIKDKDVWHRIDLKDILWIEAGGAYCTIKTVQRSYTQSVNLRMFNDKFSHPLLVRVHRSYVVNTDKISAIKGNTLIIGEAANAEIPTSDKYRDDVLKRISLI